MQHILYTTLMIIALFLVSNYLFEIGSINIKHKKSYIQELKRSNNILESTLEEEARLLSSLQEHKNQLRSEIENQNTQFQQNIVKLLSAVSGKEATNSKNFQLLNKNDIKKLLSYCQQRDNREDNKLL